MKAMTSIRSDDKDNEEAVVFVITECTRGSKKKSYGYRGQILKLDTPMEVPVTKADGTKGVIRYGHQSHVLKADPEEYEDLLEIAAKEVENDDENEEEETRPKKATKKGKKAVKAPKKATKEVKETKKGKGKKVVEEEVEEEVVSEVKETKKGKGKKVVEEEVVSEVKETKKGKGKKVVEEEVVSEVKETKKGKESSKKSKK